AAFLTGSYPIRTGYQGIPILPGEIRSIPHDFPTLPKALQSLGYSTHLVGKWHLGSASKSHTPLSYGYDSHYGYWEGFIGYFNHSLVTKGLTGQNFYSNYQPLPNVTGHYVTDLLTRKALDIIENQPKGKPLHLVVSHLAGHTGKSIGGNDGVLEVANKQDNDFNYFYIEDEIRRMYAEIIEKMDDSIGEIVKALSRKKLLDNTIVLFFSDNGAPTVGTYQNRGSNFPFRGMKMSLFDGGVRVPAMLYSGKLKNRGRIYKNLFHVTDWAPTLYAAAGGKDNLFADGINQWEELMNGGKLEKRKEILLNIDEELGYSGLIQGKYKLIKGKYLDEKASQYWGEINDTLIPSYSIGKVLFSNTNMALNWMMLSQIKRLFVLRRQATKTNCRPRYGDFSPCGEICLFDLEKDPCESRDVSAEQPEILEAMLKRLREYDSGRVRQQLNVFHPESNPDRCGGYWYNWLDEDGCWFNNTRSV
ncbi:PREDICTED: arylsulfatase B-like, partial [Nicrophorus vespilloides]|uniref:Arylsulfatase B-like n=1 Tax=Nicrophorus vespilloides TaxID=110193 RepID=A0ABM1M1C4_NICVS